MMNLRYVVPFVTISLGCLIPPSHSADLERCATDFSSRVDGSSEPAPAPLYRCIYFCGASSVGSGSTVTVDFMTTHGASGSFVTPDCASECRANDSASRPTQLCRDMNANNYFGGPPIATGVRCDQL